MPAGRVHRRRSRPTTSTFALRDEVGSGSQQGRMWAITSARSWCGSAPMDDRVGRRVQLNTAVATRLGAVLQHNPRFWILIAAGTMPPFILAGRFAGEGRLQ